MRRALLLSLLILAALPSAAGAASVRLLECEPQARSATFEAQMSPERGSERMQVRWTLQVSEGALRGWRRVAADGLDEWLTSYPGVRRYSYAKTVLNLSAPASYRMLVRFRWLDPAGEPVKRSRVRSRSCHLPDMRPNLVAVRADRVEAGYAVTLRNDGRSAAGPFSVALADAWRELDDLAPGEQRIVTFAAPPCEPGESLAAIVDSRDEVDERDEADNGLVADCLP